MYIRNRGFILSDALLSVFITMSSFSIVYALYFVLVNYDTQILHQTEIIQSNISYRLQIMERNCDVLCPAIEEEDLSSNNSY